MKETSRMKITNQRNSSTGNQKATGRRSTKRSKDGDRERERKAVQSADDDIIKKENKKKTFLQNEQLQNMNNIAEAPEVGLATDPSKMIEKPARADPRFRWCEKILVAKIGRINKEFIDNKGYKPEKITQVYYEKNGERNRYDDIVCIDATRVVLKERVEDENYIHANWMIMPDGQRYICTQGPVNFTIEDFWHMIYTEKSNVIVMLTGLVDTTDETVSKCSRYYPLDKADVVTWGIYKITQKSVEKEPYPGINWYILQVDRTDGNGTGPFIVNHFIYDTWTDHTAPESAIPAVGLFKLGRKLSAGLPITVHCSAGIGRTATFVGIDYANQKIAEKGEKFNMVDVVKDLRNMRLHAIQSAVQYLFLHVCLIELYAQDEIMPRTGNKYLVFMQNYKAVLKKFIERNRNIILKKKETAGTSKIEVREEKRNSEIQPRSGDSTMPKVPKDSKDSSMGQ